jgi:type III restriction enzyme
MASADNPILNSPYDEPARHYATDAQGNLNYRDIRPGRRIFTPDVPQVPIGQQNQGSMFDVNDSRAEYGEHLINRLRDELRAWRQSGYRGVTSRVTRDLLDYWFANPERAAHQKLFFAQQEAVEAAIWLNEVAEKSNTGTHLQTQLRQRQASAGDDTASHLPRVAFKMATGSGKTVVMACLILYHYLNRREYRNDTRYVDYFLILAPGITIRDRLNVLLPDQRNTPPATARDYYQQRTLVPPAHQHALDELAHRLIITNYHEFLPRLLGGNKRTPFDGKLGADGHKVESREDENQMLRRVLGSFKAGRRLLVINDEAHHCYLPRARGRDTELDNSETENERAAVWFSGLRACTRRFQVRVVYDLSATPYYLSGSGFPAYSLFPWVVSDFGLIEAIEAGLVKIPFLPIDDSSQAIDEPVLKNLYENCKAELPRKGQRTQRRAAQETPFGEAAPNLPALVRQALDQFYTHYEEYERGLRRRGELKADLFTAPPVFIVVCGNTTVSREVFKEIAGYERVDESGQATVVCRSFPAVLQLRPRQRPRPRPPADLADRQRRPRTLRPDRRGLQEGFRARDRALQARLPSPPPRARCRQPHRRRTAARGGQHRRQTRHPRSARPLRGVPSPCSAKAGTPTPSRTSWALRAFGSQLLCEQVAGRALRRRYYFTDPKTGKFPPEYAHIIGIPFKLFKAGQSSPVEPPEYATLRALRERDHLEIRFPNLVGYRLQTDSDRLAAEFSGTPDYRLDTTRLPVETTLGTAVSEDRQTMRLKLEELRDQTVIYKLTRDYLRRIHGDEAQRADLRLFQQVRQIVERWYAKSSKSSAKTTRSTSAW